MASLQQYTGIGQSAYVFSDEGRPQYAESSSYERDRGGRVVRRRIRYTICQWFLEPSFADNQARWAALRAALSHPEGVLHIEDENGTQLVHRRVQVAGHDLAEQWGASMAEVKITFETTEEISASVFDATFTPTGGDAVTCPQVQHWDERIEAERFSRQSAFRRDSWQTVNASGVLRANPDDLPAARLSTLQAAATALRSLDSKSGTLAFGSGFSSLMRVDKISADIADGSDELRWSLVCSALFFPTPDYAEADYEVRQQDNVQTCERITTVAGNIRAYDDSGATTKAAAISAAYATGRAQLTNVLARKAVNGQDSGSAEADTGEWSFSMTFREVLPGAAISYTLAVDDRTDFSTGLITSTYSGKVYATTSAAALAQAATLGAGKYPIPVASDLAVNTMSSGGSAAQFVEVTFSYSYQRRGTQRHAEVTMETSVQPFGAVTQTVSGFAAADTQANALSFARTFIPAGLLTDSKEGAGTAYHGATPDTLFLKQTFSYTIQTGMLGGTTQYSKDVNRNSDTRKVTTTYAGTAWATSVGAADALISAIVAGETATLMVDDRKPCFKNDASYGIFERTEFNIQFTGVLSNADTILQARYSLERIFSANNTVFTPIPFGTPYVQTNTGIVPGQQIISGTVTSTDSGAARTWARSLLGLSSGYLMPGARERMSADYQPRSTSTVERYTLEFTYVFGIANLTM